MRVLLRSVATRPGTFGASPTPLSMSAADVQCAYQPACSVPAQERRFLNSRTVCLSVARSRAARRRLLTGGGTIAPVASRASRGGELGEIVRGLAIEELRAVLLSASDRHADVRVKFGSQRRARPGISLGCAQRWIAGFPRGGSLGYRESSDWARGARPVVDELRLAAERAPSNDLVLLLERAVGRVVKVILRADDSDGSIGDLARELARRKGNVHARFAGLSMGGTGLEAARGPIDSGLTRLDFSGVLQGLMAEADDEPRPPCATGFHSDRGQIRDSLRGWLVAPEPGAGASRQGGPGPGSGSSRRAAPCVWLIFSTAGTLDDAVCLSGAGVSPVPAGGRRARVRSWGASASRVRVRARPPLPPVLERSKGGAA